MITICLFCVYSLFVRHCLAIQLRSVWYYTIVLLWTYDGAICLSFEMSLFTASASKESQPNVFLYCKQFLALDNKLVASDLESITRTNYHSSLIVLLLCVDLMKAVCAWSRTMISKRSWLMVLSLVSKFFSPTNTLWYPGSLPRCFLVMCFYSTIPDRLWLASV